MVEIKDLITAIILGIVEGLTEFLPVSSTGHMILFSKILSFTNNAKANIFNVTTQLGPILAVIIIFWYRLFNLFSIYFNQLTYKKISNNRLNLIHILIGITPTIVLGLIFYKQIKSTFNSHCVILALIIGGWFIIVGEWLKPKQPRTININNISYMQSFFIGCFQCLSLWPGFSRSGTTIISGLLVGISRCVALEFSFILAVPITLGATLLDLYKNLYLLSYHDIPVFVIGFITAFITALIVINSFLQIINHISLVPFAIYRFIIAIIIYCILP